MDDAKPVYISPAYAFVSYPNRDSTPFRDYYNINGEGEGDTCIRSNLRYQGFPEFIKALMKVGWLNQEGQEWLNNSGLTWVQVLQRILNLDESSTNEPTLVTKIKSVCEFSNELEASRIISGFRWLGLLSSEPISPHSAPGSLQPTLLDTLFARLEKLMAYMPGERDLVMLQHRFVVEWPDKSVQTLTSTLEAYGAPFGFGHSAMALTVGLPCGIATQLILDGVLNMKGVYAPYSKEICDPIREVLEAEGICMVEGVL